MIEKMFPQTVSNIIDYDAIKAAAKKYVEDVFVEIVKSFGDNLILQTMDEAHLAEVSKHVAGDSGLSVEDLLSYMNTDNIYRESEFVSELLTAFPSGVEYLEFEVTGWKFPSADFAPFSEQERSYNYDGTQASGDNDEIWMENAFNGDYVNNLLLSRYKGQFDQNMEFDWHKKSGRRSSWGDAETWMTTGGFGKPASIHINVDEERTVLEENGLSSVENWLGTVADKLPINLYVEINDIFKTNGEDTAGSTNGYLQSFPYAEGEGFCTNDPAMAVSPDVATVTYTVSYANTQLPDVQIELPESETVEDGYSIILPTMTGEYESGGKTWKPSAWDIGAFGSSYSLTGDVVAHLIFEEVARYTEITLYGNVSSTIACQNNVTSGFTGNVNTANVLQLYTDNTYTTPWKGYDYSNDYEMGVYSSDVWYSRGGTIADLPATSANPGNGETVSCLFILLDTGCLWFVCNNSNNGYGYNNLHAWFYGTITLRIYPKGQQWIPAFPYNPSYGEYDNLSTNRKCTLIRMGSPATIFGTFPAIAESFGYKSGMIKSASIQPEFQVSQAVLYLNVVGNPSLSNIVVRFENDIYTGYVRSDKADLPTAPSYDGATYTLNDDNGNYIDYDDSFTYKFVLLLNSTGNTVGGTTSTGSMVKSSTGKLQVRIRYMSSKFNRVWYYRIPIS